MIVLKVWLFLFLFIGCILQPATIPTPTPASLAIPESLTKEAWEEKWERVLAEAKREGKVTIFGSGGTAMQIREPASELFMRRYGLRVDYITGSSSEMVQKILMKRSRGIYDVDITFAGAETAFFTHIPRGIADPLEPALILPEVVDPKASLNGKIPFLDPEHKVLSPIIGEIEAQTAHSKATLMQSFRDDIPVDYLPSLRRRDPELKYFQLVTEEYLQNYNDNLKKAEEIFGFLKR